MIVIVDYGLGNLMAFKNIYNQLNFKSIISSDPAVLKEASKIILPGVGSFDFAMSSLNNSGLRATLDELILIKKIPVLGVCVGMQMMAKSSEEGELNGLGYVNGLVKKFSMEQKMHPKPLPHMGWNEVFHSKDNMLFESIINGKRFYFLHSYYFECDNKEAIAFTSYGQKFTCGIKNENIYGVQFHPEKSHDVGTLLLKNFGNL